MATPARTDVPALVKAGTDKLVAGPPAFSAYVQSGAPMPTLRRDVTTAFNQIPRWAYGLAALVAFYLAYRSYQAWKKPAPGATS